MSYRRFSRAPRDQSSNRDVDVEFNLVISFPSKFPVAGTPSFTLRPLNSNGDPNIVFIYIFISPNFFTLYLYY